MASWTTRTRTITRREWVVPLRTDHAQLLQAIHAARTACIGERVRHPHGDPDSLSDDAVMVESDGEEIIIWFEKHNLGPA